MYTVYKKDICPHTVKKKKKTPIPKAPTFYTDTYKMGMIDCKSDKIR